MKNFSLRHIVENKYSHLLTSIIVLFLIAPFIGKYNAVFPIIHLLLFLVIILTLRILKVSRVVYILVILLGCSAVILEYMMDVGFLPKTDSNMLAILVLTYVLFIGAAIFFLVKNIFSEKRITSDSIKGGISIYLLMGFWWVFLYYLVIALNPNAIISTLGEKLDLVRLYQFSFSTLTTVGYGNTVPKSELAVTMANFEAVAGQIYLTVFIARLVGMQLVAKSKTGK